jgi:adenylate cyclase
MTNVLLESGATIDKYIGDAIMCFWNAPLSTPDHPRRSCLGALAMLKGLEELNKTEGKAIKIGVGLNTGACCVGNLGSEQRFNYSAIGDAVNVAARVEGLTKQYGLAILITENTAHHASGMALLEVDLVRVIGRREPIAIYTLLGDDKFTLTKEFKEIFTAHNLMLATYRSGDFARAAEAADSARNAAPESLSYLYGIYQKRIAALRANPPSMPWDGVFTAEEK